MSVGTIVGAALSVLGSLIAFLAGLWGAGYLQDREHRRRALGVSRALAAELRRIRDELGLPAGEALDVVIYGSRSMVPEVHPWVQGIVVEAAQTDATIVAGFMEIERLLHNQRVRKAQVDAAYDALSATREAARDAGFGQESGSGSDPNWTDSLRARLEAESEERVAADLAERLEEIYRAVDRATRLKLTEVSSLLDATIGQLEADVAVDRFPGARFLRRPQTASRADAAPRGCGPAGAPRPR